MQKTGHSFMPTPKHYINLKHTLQMYGGNFVVHANHCRGQTTQFTTSEQPTSPPVWSAKTRRAPSRLCRDIRGYSLKTAAMHDNEYTLPPHDGCTDYGHA